MAKYQKKPVEIEAVQFNPTEPGGWPAWVEARFEYQEYYAVYDVEQKCYVRVNPGDWIITGVKGKHYPCSDEVFQRTYEPVEEVVGL